MSKLLRANFVRLRKMKSFWIGMAVLVFYGLFIGWDTVSAIESHGWETRAVDIYQTTCSTTLVFGLVISIVCSLFVGTEYSDGVIRNKLATGQKRTVVYLADFITCMVMSVLLAVVQYTVCGVYAVAAMGTELVDWSYLFSLAAVGCLMVMAYAAIFTFVSMLNSNKTHGVIINMLLYFGIILFSSYLYSNLRQPELMEAPVSMSVVNDSQIETTVELLENPYYLEGTKREIYQFLYDFLPGGQGNQVAGVEAEKPGLLMGYSALLTISMNIAGVLLFRRKDIK